MNLGPRWHWVFNCHFLYLDIKKRAMWYIFDSRVVTKLSDRYQCTVLRCLHANLCFCESCTILKLVQILIFKNMLCVRSDERSPWCPKDSKPLDCELNNSVRFLLSTGICFWPKHPEGHLGPPSLLHCGVNWTSPEIQARKWWIWLPYSIWCYD